MVFMIFLLHPGYKRGMEFIKDSSKEEGLREE